MIRAVVILGGEGPGEGEPLRAASGSSQELREPLRRARRPERRTMELGAWPVYGTTLLAVLLGATTAHAHTASDGFVELTVDGAAVRGRIDLAVRDLHDAIGLDDGDGALTWGEVAAREGELHRYLTDRLALRSDHGGCPITPGALTAIRRADGLHVAIALAGGCPAAPAWVELDYRAIFDVDAQHRAIVRVATAGGVAVAIASQPGAVSVDVGSPSTDVAGFVREGVRHIWIGIDHVCFLLALLLPAVLRRSKDGWTPAARFRDVVVETLEVVTAFTLAHSITLVISALGWIRLEPRLVETAIAVSVGLAAINNLVRVIDARWAVAFALGLLHGFGFSSVLAEVGLPGDGVVAALLGFNLGVELGQAAIVAVFLPLAYLARRTTGYRVLYLAGSAAMCLVAASWSIERLTS